MGILKTVDKILFGPKEIKGKPVVNLVMPISKAPSAAVSAAKGIGSVAKSVYQGAKSLLTKQALNPAHGAVGAKNIVKGLSKALGYGALVGGIYGVSKEITKAGVTGEVSPSMVKDIAKSSTIGAGLGLQKVGGAVGFLQGAGVVGKDTAKDIFTKMLHLGKSQAEDLSGLYADSTNKFKNITDNLPQSPAVNVTNVFPEMPQISSTPQILAIETPQAGITPTYAPSFSLSGSAGGLSENLPLMLLLLGGAAGLTGYAVGKRKKKKYKKRRRHK